MACELNFYSHFRANSRAIIVRVIRVIEQIVARKTSVYKTIADKSVKGIDLNHISAGMFVRN